MQNFAFLKKALAVNVLKKFYSMTNQETENLTQKHDILTKYQQYISIGILSNVW